MRNAKTVIVIVAVLAIGGGAAYLALGSGTKQAGQDEVAREGSAQQADKTAKTTGGAYVDYTGDIVAKTSGTKLIFFYAPWCSQCQALDADIKAKGVPEGVTIIKTDYDSSQALRQKYEVTIQTTFVEVDDKGNLVKKYVAYDNPTLAAVVKNLL